MHNFVNCLSFVQQCKIQVNVLNRKWKSKWLYIYAKKVVLFPEIGRVKFFSSLTHPHSRMCIRIYIFCSKKKTHTQTKTKKKQKKKKRKKMLLLLTISVENLTGYDDIIWQFALCSFNLRDQQTKRELVLKNNKLWKTFVCIVYFLFKLKTKIC